MLGNSVMPKHICIICQYCIKFHNVILISWKIKLGIESQPIRLAGYRHSDFKQVYLQLLQTNHNVLSHTVHYNINYAIWLCARVCTRRPPKPI